MRKILQPLRCLFGRHRIVCTQQIRLEGDNAVLDHVHDCFDCHFTKEFETQDLASEYADFLRQFTSPTTPNAAMDYGSPPEYIH